MKSFFFRAAGGWGGGPEILNTLLVFFTTFTIWFYFRERKEYICDQLIRITEWWLRQGICAPSWVLRSSTPSPGTCRSAKIILFFYFQNCQLGIFWSFLSEINQGSGQFCGSGMFIPDSDFYPSRIPDPKTAAKKRGEKKIVDNFFCSYKFHIIEHYFIFKMLKKKFG